MEPEPPTKEINDPFPETTVVFSADGSLEQCLLETRDTKESGLDDATRKEGERGNMVENGEAKSNGDMAPQCNPKRKRKMAIFLAYLGHGYNGMQVQKMDGVKTIENDLFAAIHAAGGISDANNDERGFQKVHWMRAARTDKGVSAVGQVVSLNMMLHPAGMIDRINHHLPKQIRVFGAKRVVRGFDARKACDKRRYEYILPGWLFAPADDPTKQKRMREALERKNEKGSFSIDIEPPKEPNNNGDRVLERSGDAEQNSTAVESHDGTDAFEFDRSCQDRLTKILQQFEGTHNYHNYTVRTAHSASNAKRYIISFGCDSTFEIDGEVWVRLVVVGQSFMMHQIRKMVGMAVATYLGIAPSYCLSHALKSSAPLLTPMAPDLGLFLDECYFDGYNKQWAELHERLCLDDFAEDVARFKKECIYPHIRLRDREDNVNAIWLSSVNELHYKFSTWGTKREHRRAAHGERRDTTSKPCSAAAKDAFKRSLGEEERMEPWNGSGIEEGTSTSDGIKRRRVEPSTAAAGDGQEAAMGGMTVVSDFALYEYSD